MPVIDLVQTQDEYEAGYDKDDDEKDQEARLWLGIPVNRILQAFTFIDLGLLSCKFAKFDGYFPWVLLHKICDR